MTQGNTDVFHESIRVSLHQKISISHRRHLQPTMFRFRHDEIHARSNGSSTDLEVTASSGRLAATCRLLVALSVPRPSTWTPVNNLRCSFFNSLTISCIDSTTRSDVVSADCRKPIKALPRALKIPVAASFPSASGDMNTQQEGKGRA